MISGLYRLSRTPSEATTIRSLLRTRCTFTSAFVGGLWLVPHWKGQLNLDCYSLDLYKSSKSLNECPEAIFSRF